MAASFTRTVSLATFPLSLESWRWVLSSGHPLVGWALWICTLDRQYSQVWLGTSLPEFNFYVLFEEVATKSWDFMWPLGILFSNFTPYLTRTHGNCNGGSMDWKTEASTVILCWNVWLGCNWWSGQSLVSLDLYHNNFTGSIPRSLGNLSNLAFL